jgi:hypothetical protein
MPAEKLTCRRRVNPQNKKTYGRQITKIQPEEIHTETGQGEQRVEEKKRGGRSQIGSGQEEIMVSVCSWLSLLMKISREAPP